MVYSPPYWQKSPDWYVVGPSSGGLVVGAWPRGRALRQPQCVSAFRPLLPDLSALLEVLCKSGAKCGEYLPYLREASGSWNSS